MDIINTIEESGGITMIAIRLQRFKGFLDSGWIDLKPITLLFGYNSSGKSSIIHSILMLKQSLENPSLDVPFVFSSQKGIDLGSFEDAVFNHKVDFSKPMVISMKVNLKNLMRRIQMINEKLIIPSDGDLEYSMEITYNQKRRFISIIGFTISDSNGNSILKMIKSNNSQNAKASFSSDYFPVVNKKNIKLEWYNFLPVIKDTETNHRIIEITEELREEIIRGFKFLTNVGPVRAIPERNQPFTGESPLHVGVQGEDALKLLYLDKYSENSRNLEEKVNRWLENYNYKYEWKIFKNTLGQFVLTDKRTGVKVSIKDVGFGISQILPIVIQVYSSDSVGTVIIEQPEIHLHSRAQSELADLFVDAIKSAGRKKIIVETHSEQLLLRLRRLLAENYLKYKRDSEKFDSYAHYMEQKEIIGNKDIAVYFIDNTNGESYCHYVEINEKGELVNVPDTFKKFFTDDFEEMMEITKLLGQMKNMNAQEV